MDFLLDGFLGGLSVAKIKGFFVDTKFQSFIESCKPLHFGMTFGMN